MIDGRAKRRCNRVFCWVGSVLREAAGRMLNIFTAATQTRSQTIRGQTRTHMLKRRFCRMQTPLHWFTTARARDWVRLNETPIRDVSAKRFCLVKMTLFWLISIWKHLICRSRVPRRILCCIIQTGAFCERTRGGMDGCGPERVNSFLREAGYR